MGTGGAHVCQAPREPGSVGGPGTIQRPSRHTAGLEDSLGRARQAVQAQRKPPRSAGAAEEALWEAGESRLGFGGCVGVLEFGKGEAYSRNGGSVCKA